MEDSAMNLIASQPAGRTSGKCALLLLLASAVLALLLPLATGCGGSDKPDPEQTLRDIVDALNRGDVQTFYDGLSADRRQSSSLQDVQGALDNVRRLVGSVPKLEVTAVTGKRVNGDTAQVDTTLTVGLGPVGLPVTDTASLQWEDGSWHLADHFLDQALSVLGLQTGNRASPSPTP